MSQAKSVSQATVRDTAVQILDQQTIRKVQNVCEALIEERTLPHFEDFVRNQSDFILTERRHDILSGVQSRLANEESAGVVLHGSYGSGKTVLMKSIAELCEEPQVLHGEELPQITFGNSEIDCFKFSLQEHDSAAKLLKAIYQSFLNSSDLTEDDLLRIYKEKKTALSLDAYDSLPPNTRS
jgi:ABC-type dipeptide/oligopeptide/nickel transport system ATPase component